MKRLLAMALLTVLLCAALALADGEIYGMMEIVNCNEWVSLREQPDTAAERLAKVPLHAAVYNCIKLSDDFYYAEYGGLHGYIKAEYLKPVLSGPLQEEQAGVIPYRELLGSGDVVLRDERDASVNVIATVDYSDGECLRVGCYRKDGTPVWGYTSAVHETTELSALDVFMDGDGEYRQVMVYNNRIGLTALDLYDGTVNWQLSAEQCRLGSSICHDVGADGSMYIAGYYGPDPVCISMNGEVRWQTSVGDDKVYWPYRIEVKDGCIVTCYDSCMEPEHAHYEAVYSLDGVLVNISVSEQQHADSTHDHL